MNKKYSCNEITKDLEVISYKEAILKEPNKNKRSSTYGRMVYFD